MMIEEKVRPVRKHSEGWSEAQVVASINSFHNSVVLYNEIVLFSLLWKREADRCLVVENKKAEIYTT